MWFVMALGPMPILTVLYWLAGRGTAPRFGRAGRAGCTLLIALYLAVDLTFANDFLEVFHSRGGPNVGVAILGIAAGLLAAGTAIFLWQAPRLLVAWCVGALALMLVPGVLVWEELTRLEGLGGLGVLVRSLEWLKVAFLGFMWGPMLGFLPGWLWHERAARVAAVEAAETPI